MAFPRTPRSPSIVLKKWLIPIIELSFLVAILVNIKKAILAFKRSKKVDCDHLLALKESIKAIFPSGIAEILAYEVAIIYYSFSGFQNKTRSNLEFSSHKKSGTQVLFLALIMMICIESVVVHLLLSQWNKGIAQILLLISVYSGVQIWGIMRSIIKQNHQFTGESLILRHGILAEAIIPIHTIIGLERNRRSPKKDEPIEPLSPLGEVEMCNLRVHINQDITINRIYGGRKTTKSIAFYVDDIDGFIEMYEELTDEQYLF